MINRKTTKLPLLLPGKIADGGLITVAGPWNYVSKEHVNITLPYPGKSVQRIIWPIASQKSDQKNKQTKNSRTNKWEKEANSYKNNSAELVVNHISCPRLSFPTPQTTWLFKHPARKINSRTNKWAKQTNTNQNKQAFHKQADTLTSDKKKQLHFETLKKTVAVGRLKCFSSGVFSSFFFSSFCLFIYFQLPWQQLALSGCLLLLLLSVTCLVFDTLLLSHLKAVSQTGRGKRKHIATTKLRRNKQ